MLIGYTNPLTCHRYFVPREVYLPVSAYGLADIFCFFTRPTLTKNLSSVLQR
jgi:hypothetical protein